MVTLFHWDLPVWAAEFGGWDSGEAASAFLEYVKVVVDALSDRVRYWFTFNEPQCFVTDVTNEGRDHDVKRAGRNVMLAHGRAVEGIRTYARKSPLVGFAPMGMCAAPVPGVMDEALAKEMTFSQAAGAMGMSWWLDPIILGVIPEPLKDTLSEDDIKTICQPLDFFAGNCYFAVNYLKRPGRDNLLAFPGMPKSATGWPVTPACLYWFTKFCWERYRLPVIITENGFANTDFIMLDGKVHDPQREDYIRRVLPELEKAIDEGVPVFGYLHWSLLDNFEWTHGFDIRFGLVYVDYKTQKRTIKDSALFYANVIKTNGGCLTELK
jgi:beta-glucosidase